jgi:hypothetical protein
VHHLNITIAFQPVRTGGDRRYATTGAKAYAEAYTSATVG